MINSLNETNKKVNFARRLQLAAKAWQVLTKPMLSNRSKMFKSWASGYYTEMKSPYHTINLLGRGVDTVVPFLVEGNPRFMVESRPGNYRRWAYITQLALNYYLDKIKLAEKVLIPAATNSMFGAAITRTCLTHSGNLRLEEGGLIKQGVPSVSLIDDANYIGDPAAKRRADFQIEGDVYRLPTEYAKDFFACVDENGNQIADYINPDGKIIRDYSPEEIAKENFDRAKLGIKDYTTFIDLYLYDENVIVTIMPVGKKAKILRTVDWKGPEGGPYDYLGYKYLPENTVPLPPAWSWYDIDNTMNTLFDKAREQAENQKKVLAYEGSAEDDVKRIVSTPNMGTARVDNIELMKEVEFGGVNPQNFEWMSFAEAEFTKQGGSPDVMGGRGAQAPTLGQEQMIFNNATRIVRNFSGRFDSFTTSIVKKLAWDFWFNPVSFVPVLREIPGVGQLPAVFSDAEKVGDFYDFIFKLTPFSMQRESPEIKYQKMLQFVSAWIVPTMSIAAQQGSMLDVPRVTRLMAEYLGFENFNQWYRTATPHELENVPYKMLPMGSKSPGQTDDRFGATEASRTANMNQQQMRAGGQSSPSQ